MQVMQYLSESGVDLNFLVACFLPFGSGNDLPRQLGFGGDATQKYLSSLESLISELLLKCKPAKLDVWEVEAKPREDGALYVVDTFLQEPVKIEGFKRFMGNYFTIGDECKAGYRFDMKKNFNHSKLLRQYLFNINGLQTAITDGFSKSLTHLDYCKALKPTSHSFESDAFEQEQEKQKEMTGNEQILFRGVNSEVKSDFRIRDIGSLVVNNLNSFMGGRVKDLS